MKRELMGGPLRAGSTSPPASLGSMVPDVEPNARQPQRPDLAPRQLGRRQVDGWRVRVIVDPEVVPAEAPIGEDADVALTKTRWTLPRPRSWASGARSIPRPF